MRNNSFRRNPKLAPFGFEDIVSDHLYIPCHKAGSAAGKVLFYSNVSALNTEFDIVAGTPDYANNRGRMTCDGSTYIALKNNQAIADFVKWWGADPYQMVMVIDVYWATTPANQYLFSFSAAAPAGKGGYGVLSISGTNVQPKINTNGVVTNLASIQGLAATTPGRYVLLWDGKNLLLQQALNGTIGAAKSFTAFPSDIHIADGCSFAGRSSASSPGNIFRASDAIGNIFMLKPSTDISASFAAIVADTQKYPNDIAAIFKGV